MPPWTPGSVISCSTPRRESPVADRRDANPTEKDRRDAGPTAFADGDYASAALKGGEHEWQTYAALGLIGKARQAIAGLARFDHPQAAFYSAVAYWIDGDDDTAAALLARIPGDHARNLLALLRQPQIEVLAQLPWRRAGCADLLSGAAADSRFRVRNISFQDGDLPNKPYADIREFLDDGTMPDFYICSMIEWHLVPPNLHELTCPLFGQTADYDLHIQTVYPWLGLFDAVLVTDPSEWRDVRRLVRAPVCTFPKSFGVPNGLPSLPQNRRDVDVYLSGTMLHPYHPDKAQLLHQLLEVPDLRLKVLNGFNGPAHYYEDLARSKICITYVRHPTALPTRGLEALAMGCAVVVQHDSVLTLFAGPEQGVLTYRLGHDDLPAALRTIAANWPTFARRAEAGARLVREEFALDRVASQYLRFLTFLAARPRPPRSLRSTDGLCQKRGVLHKGWLPSHDHHHSPILKSIGVHNERHLRAVLDSEADSPQVYIDLAREVVLTNYHRAEDELIPVRQWLTYLSKVYRAACQRFPRCLVARFNAIRVLLHFGGPNFRSEALQLLDETLAFPAEHWQIDVMEDVFPWDLFPQYFNYRGYFDRVTAHLMGDASTETDLCRLIRASLYAYRGLHPSCYGIYSQSLDDFQAAVDLDPDFPYYRLWYAEQLLRRGLPEDRTTACRLLRELAAASLIFREALQMLESIEEPLEELAVRAARTQDVLEVRELSAVPVARPIEWKRSFVHKQMAELEVERDDLRAQIKGMKSSKFWKIRMVWIGLKHLLLGKPFRRPEGMKKSKKSFFNLRFVLHPFQAEFSWHDDLRR